MNDRRSTEHSEIARSTWRYSAAAAPTQPRPAKRRRSNRLSYELCVAVARPCHSAGTRAGLNWLPRGVGVWACARPVVAPKGQPNVQLTGGSHTQEELVSTPVRTGGSPTQEELVSTPVRTGGSPNQEELVSTPVRIVHAASPPRRAASTRSREPRAAAADGAQQLPVVAPGARGNARARARVGNTRALRYRIWV